MVVICRKNAATQLKKDTKMGSFHFPTHAHKVLLLSDASYHSTQRKIHMNRILTECEGSIRCIHKMHAKIITGGYGQNVFIGSKLINMYAGLDQLHMNYARKVFHKMHVFLWNMMIQTYANSGLSTEALNVYKEMCENDVAFDKYTFTFTLKACSVIKNETTGRVIHGHVVKTGGCLMRFLIRMLLVGIRLYLDALAMTALLKRLIFFILFYMMNESSCSTPDHATLVSILPACAQVAEVRLGFWIHCYAIKTGLTNDAMVGSAMYGNSGHLDYARQVFDQISERNIMVWTAMMRAYGMHGNPHKALTLFSNFLEGGFQPDGVVFLCLLSTCSHAGLVSKGSEIFKQMEVYGVGRGHEHYACMVDLYGRAGLLMEAVEFVKSMPVLPSKDVYGVLLGACRMHNNIELAEVVAQKLFILDPNSGGRYVTLAKIYGDG
ncbi:putative tetratricopeptide-like helical domain superfamily [Helianthus annuus]|nr:putative tetratricopeptide-like helical domain superfamily [Helianthus annuus]KAJ0748758.1 putative tetratricopeptide-like helical domain superfamily [Helianthus annuus]KAJ0920989.1 putative tetratricopeptide-like helical domain superfamily [Helianthus annuus]